MNLNYSPYSEIRSLTTLFLSVGPSLESLNKVLGHKNIATTHIYAKILNEKVGRICKKYHTNLRGWKALLFHTINTDIYNQSRKVKDGRFAFFCNLATTDSY